MNQKNQLRKNPSRETCESIIRRILMTELTQNGKNRHFRKATDFMSYFESLYPASDALTKQVQRAVQSLHMPKDADGFFIVDKTAAQVEQEQCLGKLFADANVSLHPMEQVETVFLSVPSHMQELLLHTFEQSDLFAGQILTIVRTCNGLLIYTEDKKQLLSLLNRLINQQSFCNVVYASILWFNAFNLSLFRFSVFIFVFLYISVLYRLM